MGLLIRLLSVSTVFLFVLGCSNTTKITSDLGIKGAPDWVNEGTQAVNDKKGRLIHGVGSAPEMGDISLQKSTADGRARTEIARVVSTFIDASVSDYSASTGDNFSASVERDIQSTTQVALSGTKIIGHWKDKKTGVLYSFAELDMKKLQSAIASAEAMNSGFKSYLTENLDANFDRFIKESY